MKLSWLAPVLLFCLSTHAQSLRTLHCHYQFMGNPLWDVIYQLNPDETPSSSVVVSNQGQTHKETFTPVEEKSADELLHGWISKQDPQNSIEAIIYRERQTNGQSKLINPHMPIAKEVWGDCD